MVRRAGGEELQACEWEVEGGGRRVLGARSCKHVSGRSRVVVVACWGRGATGVVSGKGSSAFSRFSGCGTHAGEPPLSSPPPHPHSPHSRCKEKLSTLEDLRGRDEGVVIACRSTLTAIKDKLSKTLAEIAPLHPGGAENTMDASAAGACQPNLTDR